MIQPLVWFVLLVTLGGEHDADVAAIRADSMAQCQQWRDTLIVQPRVIAISTCIKVEMEPTHGN